jgi:hypothetical protein
MDSSRSSQRTRGARSSRVGVSAFGSSKGEGSMLPYISKNPETPKAPKVGPAVLRSILSRPSKGDTWRPIEPSRRFTHRDSEAQGAAPSYSDTRGAGNVQDSGPQHRRAGPGPSDLRRTRGAKFNHLGVSLIATMISKDQPLHIRERRKCLRE